MVDSTTNVTVRTLTKGEAGGGQFLRRVTLDIYGILGQDVWNLNSTGGNTTWSPVWRSGKDYCKDVNGQCGINGICRLTSDNMPDCFCPPQFDFIDSNDHLQGCVPKSSPGQNCIASSNMSLLQNTSWLGGSDYSGFHGVNESGCRQACMEDCMCIVVTYADTVCMKKQLPLVDGRQDKDISIKAYVKVFDNFQAQRPYPPPLPHQQQRKESEEKRKTFVVIGISLLVGSSIVLAASFLMICFCLYGYKARSMGEQQKVVEGLAAYAYKEIDTATGSFRHELGRGAFGMVYKGTLPEGRAIAVKTLKTYLATEGEGEHAGEREFRTEMRVIGTSRHKNLVQLYAFCDEGSHRLLVYECMCNGSLDRALLHRKARTKLESPRASDTPY
ncbi:hypothetical protein KI387_033703 [Taxus chinensis]|uniref:non-specific serine/threonine protein kinase n=1 Tax=Taxus chinensis TaxID=29808 RepID=A0AA38F567_TAXCH|nr:hypothetical protein KI387_033703 [Taxus chinensis]